MKIGICGYGNLGKAFEQKIIKDKKDDLVAIFSRRSNISSEYKTPIFNFEDAKNFKGKIDVMVMCGGSQEDLGWQSPKMLEFFDIIDTFDTHAKISEHRKKLESASKKYGHKAIYSAGWDPGLFSIIRTISANIFQYQPQTFWGNGVSQGHSEALRNIVGVADAIQFTVPNEEMIEQVKLDVTKVMDENEKHKRMCFIALDGTRSGDEIISEIKNTENYFKNQKVEVYFESENKIKQLKESMFHQGKIFAGDKNSSLELKVKMDNNPNFTAQILYAYIHVLPKIKKGVYNTLEIPVALLGTQDNSKYI